MSQHLLARAAGTLSQRTVQQIETSQLLHAIQAAPGIQFDGSDNGTTASSYQAQAKLPDDNEKSSTWAHKAGVNCLTIDRFEGRYMLSGGSDSSILLWDLESVSGTTRASTYSPVGKADKTSSSHKFGITQLSFYPFDSQAFLSSSYDHTLKLYATETLAVSASFNLDSILYSHASSPIADHLLVACASQHPAVRLVDLRSGANAHSLAGHQGAVLSVAWSPKDEFVLASGGLDDTVRLWDIRSSASCLGVLDLEDSVGMGGEDGFGSKARARTHGRAHTGPCNGVVWKDDGAVIVTSGHDERVRVWDVATGANTLAHFGPIIKNTNLSILLPLLVPTYVGKTGEGFMLYPNEKEILMFDLFEGTLLKRLRIPEINVAQAKGAAGQRSIRNRVTSLCWRAGNIEYYSAHSDGLIRAWKPQTKAELELDREEAEIVFDSEDNERKRKRQVLDDMFRDLTKQKITFT
ncbi:uncharacterized protein KY384_001904 [Bacidia gigantensis]|uniref:uncharacterized protein n=1 Tax=Bacidia gigantensis TaxID=2732470 RepID=UPI001D03832C|nr:uncharacterized protein KY384_001904 [Bacidia gigantensis]KAG8533121.1 hypothetical protein KY384_001904 [Bacidia gigantensis]